MLLDSQTLSIEGVVGCTGKLGWASSTGETSGKSGMRGWLVRLMYSDPGGGKKETLKEHCGKLGACSNCD